jgi:hypothetical protein
MYFSPISISWQSEVTVLAPALFRQPNTILKLIQADQHHDERRALAIKRHDCLLNDMEFLVDGAGAPSPRGDKSA